MGCACRWPLSTRWPGTRAARTRAAGAHPRPAAARGQRPFPTIRNLFAGQCRAGRRAGDHRRRAHRVGKGTLAAALAARLGYHTLDSGFPVPRHALAALQDGIAPDDEATAGPAGRHAGPALRRHRGGCCVGRPVGDDLRREDVGSLASRVAALPAVREALHGLQLAFRRPPGLVADGRDMGTVIFPDAALKVFLTASAAQRASRRHKQLISKGIQARLDDLRVDLEVA